MARLSSILALAVFYLSSLGSTSVNPAVNNTAAIVLPPGTGKYGVGTIELQLVDYSRSNPFAAANVSTPGPRAIMVQLFYPAKNVNKYPLAPYMGPRAAAFLELSFGVPAGAISLVQSNSHKAAPIKPCDDIQAILFSTGYGAARQVYTTYAEELASHGYLVIAIDHPYDAAVVEFADGSIVFADPETNLSDPTTLTKLRDVRVQDTLFTMNLLYTNLTESIPGVRTRLRIQDTGMFGHSLGGTTTTSAMLLDSRICGGMNLDGQIGGQVLENSLARPFVLMGTPEHNLTSDNTWEEFWEHQSGWKRALVLADSRHLSYCDFPVLTELYPAIGDTFTPEDLELLFGSIDALRGNVVQRAYIREFFDSVMRGRSDALFDGPDTRYPEISFQG